MIAVAAALAGAFNLVCLGSTTTFPKSGESTEKAFSQVYRLDLNSGRWCDGACDYTMAINRIEPTRITLTNSSSAAGWTEKYLNRETGELMITTQVPWVLITTLAKCEIAPFSGFPALKF